MTTSSGPAGGDDPMRDLPIAEPPQRISGMRLPESWRLPGKPADLDPAADDAWRQTGFQLAEELRLLQEGLELQLAMARTGYTPGARTMTMAAFASLWSRAFLSSTDVVALVRKADYQGATALVRQVVEFVGAQANLGHELDSWRRWAHEAYTRDEATRATAVGVGHYFGGEAIAADEHLRVIYRAASDFARPNFGPTALFVAGDASHERYPLIFADQAFHLGWAQLLLGWLLRVGVTQLHVAMHLAPQFPAPPELRERVVAHAAAVERLLASSDRCRVEEVEDADRRRRHLLRDFRRQSADAPRR
ncbi:MAG: hypothetical protein FJZ92_09240, partial [Chloroflexi bacterium]|nr:hypothetical protein [Chloroflexota bacterium]